jgi:hypothetical protein
MGTTHPNVPDSTKYKKNALVWKGATNRMCTERSAVSMQARSCSDVIIDTFCYTATFLNIS